MLEIVYVSFKYHQKNVLQSINLNVKKGSHVSIMGESGCGKSTLLKAIYGLLDIYRGSIKYQNKLLLGPEQHLVPGHHFIKFLTQELDIMPYTTVFENVAEHLSRFFMEEREKRALELIEVVDLIQYKDTKVQYLSGGQKQRVALAKVLAKEPEILLLDEPFSQIDHFRKNELRYRLFNYLKLKNISCIVATHDKNDVLPFADNLIVLKNGKKVFEQSPKFIFENPKDKYVAALFSEINELPASFFDSSYPHTKIILYPHELKIISTLKENIIMGIVKKSYYFGEYYILKVATEAGLLTVKNNKALPSEKMVKLYCSNKTIQNRLELYS